MEFFTIGIYNSSSNDFFQKLVSNNIDTFCDIRQRRGVRGSKYAFVNSKRLQAKLEELDIKYGHIKDLAPTKEIRELQKNADLERGEKKRQREELGEVFKSEYIQRILNNFDFELFFDNLENIGAKKIVLFCVEEKPKACHRSLVTNRLAEEFHFKITHI